MDTVTLVCRAKLCLLLLFSWRQRNQFVRGSVMTTVASIKHQIQFVRGGVVAKLEQVEFD
jgi:hypothetical protein